MNLRFCNVSALALLLGCGSETPQPTDKPVTIDNPVSEASLTTVSLSEDAERRLGVAVDSVVRRRMGRTRELPGEVLAVPGSSQQLVAPAAGVVTHPDSGELPVSGSHIRQGQHVLSLVPLSGDRDLQRVAEDLQAAEVRLTRARLEADRAAALWRDRLISARDKEAADAEVALASGARDAAAGRARLSDGARGVPAGVTPLLVRSPLDGVVRSLSVGSGQVVAAGAALLEVARLDQVWVRVPAYAGDIERLDVRRGAAVRLLGSGGGPALVASPIAAPPTADPVAASSDVYYAVANRQALLRPGQRVLVSVPMTGAAAEVVAVPWAAVVFDYSGSAWVYERIAERRYARRRIALGAVSGGWAEVRAGIAIGAVVVTDGAAELLGTEFGAGK
ncbi:MAG: Cobalt-zinc-cadmium resistance protein CzcB [Gemmatimonadaceae bacterium]|nr:Cobalt-zinc-cadmium resistance protein CzcB [Gemmatimonadaceae bacterium]